MIGAVKAEHSEALFLAETLGCTPQQTLATTTAGFDIVAAAFSTGVMMPIGFEYGFRKPLHVVSTTPEDWETPPWDLTEAIAAINRTKAAHRPLNEEGPLQPEDLGNPKVFGFRKKTRDGREEVLVVLNLDPAGATRARVPSRFPTAPRLAWTDPLTGATRPLPSSGELELGPSGVAVVHGVEPVGSWATPATERKPK